MLLVGRHPKGPVKHKQTLMETEKHSILFVLHLPPPVHGAAMVGKYIHDSKAINGAFRCHYFNLTLARSLDDIGKGGARKLVGFVRQLLGIRRAVRQVRPALCYVTPNAKAPAFYKDFVVVQMLKGMGCRVVVHFHNKGVATRQGMAFDDFLYRRFFKGLKVILLADVLYDDIRRYVARKDVYVCPNGIPTVDICRHAGPSSRPVRILFLSNMIAAKGVWVLLEACRLLKERGMAFVCDFVGKWGDVGEQAFNDAVAEKGLGGLVLAHGAKYGADKAAFFGQADVFVFPTYYANECFPIVLLEAMQYGLPCISTAEGGIRGIIDDGVTGYVVGRQDAEALADRMAYLIVHPEVRRAMGEKGREKFAEQFTLQTFEGRMKDILADCIQ